METKQSVNSKKPLGGKSYGSIPHLPQSKLGEGDHHCEFGQATIATDKPRDKHDLIIVQEKLDGSNCCVAKINGEIHALTRAGYEAMSSPFVQHHYFQNYVDYHSDKFWSLLNDGERIVGEWLAMAHGTRYNLPHEPFVVFDLMKGNDRLCYIDFLKRVAPFRFPTPRLIHIGQPIGVKWVLKQLEVSGHGAIDEVEGAIWRVERNGRVDFVVKYKRHESEDGRYLPEKNGGSPLWNCDISLLEWYRKKLN